MENTELNLIPEEEIEKPKFYYDTTFEAKEEVPIHDEYDRQIGTETVVKGRILKRVWIDEEEIKKVYRAKRTTLLSAFDKWEKAVLRGREQDDYIIMSWYRDLLELKESAFENIPTKIEYYL